MKKIIFFLVLVFASSLVFSQVHTIYNPNLKVTITKEQIRAIKQHTPSGPAGTTVLDFEGIGDDVPVGNYYNGGGGTNYGIAFSSNTLALIQSSSGGSGNFCNPPSPVTAFFFISGVAVMDVAAGFTTGFSFYYTSSQPITIYVWDGTSGTGNMLNGPSGTTFPANYNTGSGCPCQTGTWCHWDPVGVSFAGTAKSVTFSGAQNQCAFDNVTFGSATPGGGGGTIPTISQWGLIILGFLFLTIGTIVILRWRSTSA